jgi:dehydrogenase/reductase SDR family protein 13
MAIAAAAIGTIAALTAASTYFLRYRISRSWIDYRERGPTDLSGKVIIVTGANVGLGYESARDFARRNGTVVLACRDAAKGQEAVESIKKLTGNDNVECLSVDLASLASVRAFAATVTARYPSIYALVCNAGVWVPMEEGRKTADGYEIHFGINHLGHLALIRSVVAHMTKSKEDGRVVLVSSGLLRSGKLDLDRQDFVHEGRKVRVDAGGNDDGDSNDEKKKKKKGHASFAPTGYCDSKLMNALTVRHVATMLCKTAPHVTTYAVCPGFCRTSLGRNVKFPLYKKLILTPVMLLIQRTSVQGAQNVIHATLEDKGNLKSGEMYRDGEVAQEETEYVDSLGKDVPRRLWELSEKLV